MAEAFHVGMDPRLKTEIIERERSIRQQMLDDLQRHKKQLEHEQSIRQEAEDSLQQHKNKLEHEQSIRQKADEKLQQHKHQWEQEQSIRQAVENELRRQKKQLERVQAIRQEVEEEFQAKVLALEALENDKDDRALLNDMMQLSASASAKVYPNEKCVTLGNEVWTPSIVDDGTPSGAAGGRSSDITAASVAVLFGDDVVQHGVQAEEAASNASQTKAIQMQTVCSETIGDHTEYVISTSGGGQQCTALREAAHEEAQRINAEDEAKIKAQEEANMGVLRPSLKGTKAMKMAGRDWDIRAVTAGIRAVTADIWAISDLRGSKSAVTNIAFGQERLYKAYILLATSDKAGSVVIYRIYRTELEIGMLADQDFPLDVPPQYSTPPAEMIAIHSRLVGHSHAITSMLFTSSINKAVRFWSVNSGDMLKVFTSGNKLLEDQLVTSSIDKTVRFWSVDSGEMLKVFTYSSCVPVATILPFNPQVFVAANCDKKLRVVDTQSGTVLQQLKVENEVRALKFDDTGLFLLAGTKIGSILVLEASDSSTLKLKFKIQIGRVPVCCITFVPASYGQPPYLLVNTPDSSATIIDCIYGPPAGVLTNLAVRHRVGVANSRMPLRCCYSPSDQGYLISGSEDTDVYIYSLAKGSNYKFQYLVSHKSPVIAVSVNLQDTLLASADALGRIILWRRMDFSHISEP